MLRADDLRSFSHSACILQADDLEVAASTTAPPEHLAMPPPAYVYPVLCVAAGGVPSPEPGDAKWALLAVQNSEDLLDKIGQFACNALRPAAACAFAACSRGLRAVMSEPLIALRTRHKQAVALAAQVGSSCAALAEALVLDWDHKDLTVAHIRTLGMLLGSGSLPLVESIYLWNNVLGAEGALAFCDGLGCGAAPSLGRLFLGNNLIGPAGAAALAAALGRGALPKLHVLHLGGNGLGPEGARSLCDGLGCGAAPRLVSLDIPCNSVGDEGCAALADALGRGALPKLEGLDLSHNDLGNRGLATLAKPLRRHPALEVLYVADNRIRDCGVEALVGGLDGRELKKLTHLFLDGNPVSDFGYAGLVAALDAGELPALSHIGNSEKSTAVRDAVARNRSRRRSASGRGEAAA